MRAELWLGNNKQASVEWFAAVRLGLRMTSVEGEHVHVYVYVLD